MDDKAYIAQQIGDVYGRLAKSDTEMRKSVDYLTDSIGGILNQCNTLKKKTNRLGVGMFLLGGVVGFGGYLLQQQVDNLNAKVTRVIKEA